MDIVKRLVHRWPLMLIALVCGVLAAMVDALKDEDKLVFSLIYLFHALIYTLAFCVLAKIGESVLAWLGRDREISASSVGSKGKRWFTYESTATQLCLVAAVMFLCWVPYLVITYPGVLWYDTQQQLLQWFKLPNLFNDGSHLSDHHPVLDTAIYGLFVDLGNLLGSGDFGLFLLSLLQALVMAFSLSAVVLYCRHIGLTRRFCVAILAFFALFPIVPVYTITLAKDSLFLPFCIWFSLVFIETARSKGQVLKRPLILAIFIASALLMAFTKKTGVYIVLLSCVLLLFFLPRKGRMRTGCVALVTLLVMALFNGVVLPAAHIAPSGKQEMLANAFQQSALVMKRRGNEIPKDDRKVLDAMLGHNAGDRYAWGTVDPVKGFSWSARQNDDLSAYLKVWAKEAFQFPGTYLEAYLSLQRGWIGVPDARDGNNTGDLLMTVQAQDVGHVFKGSEKFGLSALGHGGLRVKLENAVRWFAGSPFGMLIFARAFWALWLVVFVLYECLRRENGHVAWLLVYLVTFLTLWISPISANNEAMRYLITMVFLAPLALAATIAPNSSATRDAEACA
ncbi:MULTISPECIES: DUF6020 family protein [unclassified Bifidobacterium]|uniref:DUF6020 family protein n=1 Tax=unclassified Bifidobacterium TaxID=2608897 RepID=UPI0023F754E3|nr:MULTISPECIES: DUF6020 family protein [unclassified Bifidobacterium]WEV65985.1 DUF6020 family protein [Bifidobacterium sp. ESL0764]WEV75226.1 DUF6020 family protein [Bifidobacterium sp. ESL0800]